MYLLFGNKTCDLFLYSVLINMDPVNKLSFFDWMILISAEYVVYIMCVCYFCDCRFIKKIFCNKDLPTLKKKWCTICYYYSIMTTHPV